ncbi:MAG: hypothetical protein RLZZ82_534 [Actinomycetota bacterium]|jgi:hypothetical protein
MVDLSALCVGKTSGLGISNTHNFWQFADKPSGWGYKHPVGQGGGDFGTLHVRTNFYGQGI